jgi:FkbM family methyltransferase
MLPKLVRRIAPERVKNAARKFVWLRLNPSWQLKSGITVRVLSYNDWMIYNDIFVEAEYDRPIADLIGAARRTTEPAHVLDLGGNVGFFTLRTAHQFLSAGLTNFRITTVEGSPSNYGELQERLQTNDSLLGGKVIALHGLVGQRSGSASITEGASHGENTIVQKGAGGTAVAFLDLEDAVSRNQSIDLLKCDIEGAEEMFIRSYPELLRGTARAVFEFHHDACDIAFCRQQLKLAGFDRAEMLREFGRFSVEYFSR